MEVVSPENFAEWEHHPVTKRLMKMLESDREAMKEGLINNSFEDEAEVKGRCRAIAIILNLEYDDLFEATPQKVEVKQ
jgi:hypothetical protein